ncbi:SDR family oxidoreductase [Paracoccaceae bacterium]
MKVLITGAGRGIGLALAAEAEARGHEVIGTTRGPAPAEPAIRWERLEVTDPAEQAALATRLAGVPLSLLICNAGVYAEKSAPGYGPQVWQDSFATNVMGVWLTVQAHLPALRAAKGKIAIIASQMGSSARAPGGSYAYRASKAAAVNLGRNLATDLRREGIAVGIYHPGWVRTEMGGSGAEIDAAQAARGLMDRFAALSPATSGCFEDWQGQALPL